MTTEADREVCRQCGQWRIFYGHEPKWLNKKVGTDGENLTGHPFR